MTDLKRHVRGGYRGGLPAEAVGPPTRKLAHESDDDTIPVHCPWCGSGQIVANGDGSIACQYCQRAFTVRLQPTFSTMPQEMDQYNAGAPDLGNDNGLGPQSDMNAATGQPAEQPVDAGAPQPPGQQQVEPETPTYQTLQGALLTEQDYLDHLAIAAAGDREEAVLAAIRQRRLAQDMQTMQITVTGPPDQLASFAQTCRTIEQLCSIGSSRTLHIPVDGDGSGAMRFDLGDAGSATSALPDDALDDDPIHLPGIGE